MKTVVLDGYCANPGDLGWDWLGRFGSGTVYDRTPAAETAGRIGDAEAVLTNKTVIDRAVMANCPGLRYIGVMAIWRLPASGASSSPMCRATAPTAWRSSPSR